MAAAVAVRTSPEAPSTDLGCQGSEHAGAPGNASGVVSLLDWQTMRLVGRVVSLVRELVA